MYFFKKKQLRQLFRNMDFGRKKRSAGGSVYPPYKRVATILILTALIMHGQSCALFFNRTLYCTYSVWHYNINVTSTCRLLLTSIQLSSSMHPHEPYMNRLKFIILAVRKITTTPTYVDIHAYTYTYMKCCVFYNNAVRRPIISKSLKSFI